MKLIIRTEQDRAKTANEIMALDVSGGYVVDITQPKNRRSVALNALYWLWVSEIAKVWGYSKDDAHARLKLAHSVPILCRDENGFNEMWMCVQGVQDDEFHLSVARLVSTTKFNNKQMCEYLTEIENDLVGEVFLPHPEDLYYESMGIKR